MKGWDWLNIEKVTTMVMMMVTVIGDYHRRDPQALLSVGISGKISNMLK